MKTTSNIRVKRKTKAIEEIKQARATANVPTVKTLNDRKMIKYIPKRRPDGNKGSFGKVLCIAGSRNMAGAAILSARAAFAAGAGMVMVLTDECNREIIQSSIPEALLTTYDEEILDEVVTDALTWANVTLIGPGLSMSDAARDLLDIVLEQTTRKPLVIDADALNILSSEENATRLRGKNVIITPHLAEMGRLVNMSVSEIQKHMRETAEAFSTHHSISVILKDAVSVIASPGRKTYENHSGNSGMATAGSGDVLSGIIAGLLAQGVSTPDAAVLGPYIHGRAGDFAAEELTEYSMTAGDIIRHLPDVFKLAIETEIS